tara:strand:+ start:140 stop:535 length:396 start_codon:yes stop_codon:yes gene_type:complete
MEMRFTLDYTASELKRIKGRLRIDYGVYDNGLIALTDEISLLATDMEERFIQSQMWLLHKKLMDGDKRLQNGQIVWGHQLSDFEVQLVETSLGYLLKRADAEEEKEKAEALRGIFISYLLKEVFIEEKEAA